MEKEEKEKKKKEIIGIVGILSLSAVFILMGIINEKNGKIEALQKTINMMEGESKNQKDTISGLLMQIKNLMYHLGKRGGY